MIRVLLIKLAVIVLPIGIMISMMNYLVDPANIFTSKKYIEGVAAILSSGHNVDNISNYDERMLQEQLIKQLVITPDIVVLGSSRVMEIGSDFFPGKRVLNCGVSHGNIHDVVAILGLLDSLNRLPAEVYINLDPWLIGEYGSTEWQTLKAYHNYFIRKNSGKSNLEMENNVSNEIFKLSSIISFSYFKKSVDYLLKGSSKQYYDVGENRPTIYGRFSDGTICYPSTYTNPDTLKVASDALNTGLKEGIPQPDNKSIALMYVVLNFLEEKHIKIHLFMLPVHPEYFRGVNTRQPGSFESEKTLFLKTANKYHITITGDFNAQSSKLGQEVFYDMYHCNREAIKTVGISR